MSHTRSNRCRMVRARLSWLVTHRPVRCQYKTEPILACSALPRRRRSAIASAERNDRASQGVGRISASKLRFASAVEVPSKATEIWTSVGSWVWLRVARRQPAILLRWLIAIATMTTVRSSRCRRGGSTGDPVSYVGSKPSHSPAAQPPLRRKRSRRDVGIKCGAGQPGLGYHDFQAPQFLFDRRQVTCAKDVWSVLVIHCG
jgi:hypothetical protein